MKLAQTSPAAISVSPSFSLQILRNILGSGSTLMTMQTRRMTSPARSSSSTRTWERSFVKKSDTNLFTIDAGSNKINIRSLNCLWEIPEKFILSFGGWCDKLIDFKPGKVSRKLFKGVMHPNYYWFQISSLKFSR